MTASRTPTSRNPRFYVRDTGAGWVIEDRTWGRVTTQTWAEARAMLEATRLEIFPARALQMGWRPTS